METRMAKHNKKRNVGLLHEQLVRHASEMTVEGNNQKSNEAIDILMKHFHKDSEMLKEFRLFSSLIHTQVSNSDIARRIIQESRHACENHDPVRLMKEKSSLIKDVNYMIDRKDFYDQRIKDYKLFTTVQALLNEWRGKNFLSPDERVKYELVLERHLAREETLQDLNKTKNANPLVLNIMVEKFNKKYKSTLNKDQRHLLEAKLTGDDEKVIEIASKIKEKSVTIVKDYFSNCDNKVLLSKKSLLESKLKNYYPDNSDESLSKALTLSKLLVELEEKNV